MYSKGISFSVAAQSTWSASGTVSVAVSGWTPAFATLNSPHQLKVAATKLRIDGNNLQWGLCTVDKSNVPAGTYWATVVYFNGST